MKTALALAACLLLSAGCSGLNGSLFPDAPYHSFTATPAIGPGPVEPLHPTSAHTFDNPAGR